MNDSHLKKQTAAATAYEELFVPALFLQWAPLLIEAAKVSPGDRVLDVACGTGILAREVAAHVGSSELMAGLDLTPGMLEVARGISPDIVWKQGLAEDLPFPDRSFEAVVSQFGLMFFQDRAKALQEMLRVLVPGGYFAAAVWDSLANIPAFAEEVALLEHLAGEDAANALRAPFVLGNESDLMALVQDAGISSVQVETHEGTAQFPSIRSLVEADLRGWLPVMGVTLEENMIEQILEEADETLDAHVNAQGEAVFQISAHIISGQRE